MNQDVLIIGGGVIGLSLARELHKKGVESIAVVDRGKLGGEASYAAAGMLAPNAECKNIDDFHRLCTFSAELYPELADELLTETQIDIQLDRSGTLYLAFSEKDADDLHDLFVRHNAAKLNTERLDQHELAVIEPNVSSTLLAGLCFPNDWQVDNRLLLKALRTYAEQSGIETFEDMNVSDVIVKAGRVAGVETAGGVIGADCVVLATGAWTSLIKIGGSRSNFSVRPIRGQMLAFRAPGLIKHVIYGQDVYLVPRADGRILAGATVEDVGFVRGVDDEAIERLRKAAVKLVPALAQAEIVETWSGLRPFAADGLPVIGEVPNARGLYVATAHYRNGILLAPATAKAAAAFLIDGERDEIIAPFGLGRFNASGVTA